MPASGAIKRLGRSLAFTVVFVGDTYPFPSEASELTAANANNARRLEAGSCTGNRARERGEGNARRSCVPKARIRCNFKFEKVVEKHLASEKSEKHFDRGDG